MRGGVPIKINQQPCVYMNIFLQNLYIDSQQRVPKIKVCVNKLILWQHNHSPVKQVSLFTLLINVHKPNDETIDCVITSYFVTVYLNFRNSLLSE